MVATLAIEPVSSGTTHLLDYRHRPAMGERTVLPDSAQKPQAGAQTRNEQRQHDRRQDASPSPQPPRSGSSIFAAAVIAGSLPPTPQSMEELIRRIGSSEIPEESQARLKDLLA